MSTEESAVGADTVDSREARLDALERAIETLRDENQELKQENELLRERVDELETEVDDSATVRMPTNDIADITVEPEPDGEAPFPLGRVLKAKADNSDFEILEDRVDAIEDGEADVIVRSETDRDALPIENRIARRQAGDGSLTANEERATIVFPKFGSHAESWNGQLKLSSQDVRTILGEHTDKDVEDWNTNTINRTMRKVAQLTSSAEEGDRHAKGEENLLTLQKGEKRLLLVADREEWMEFLKEASED